jgi:hypothetical protein
MREPQKPEYRRKQEHAAQERQEAQKHEDNVKIIAAMNRVADEQHAANYEDTPKDKGKRYREIATIVGIYVAASVALIAIWISHKDSSDQINALSGQLKAMQGQLDAMEADQRPWVRIEAFPGDLRAFPATADKPFPSIIFDPHFKMTNVGKSPAFNAQFYLIGYAINKDHNDPNSAQKEACERMRRTPLDNAARGHLLFPGDFFDEGAGVGKYNVAFMGPQARQYFAEENGSLSLTFYIIGCVDYVFGKPIEHHQTGFVFEVWQTKEVDGRPTISNSFTTSEGVSADNIRLIPNPSSSLAD